MNTLLLAHKGAASELLQHVQGFIYPNELNLLWSVLIVLYPYLTGLVAGAFIMASLERVFKVKSLQPTYRLSLLTSLAFLLVAPLPLLFHLGHPERCFEVMMTPHASSPMAIFGFVYAWYLMAVLLLELWFDYRKDFVEWSQTATGLKRWIYSILTLGVRDVSGKALLLDDKMGRAITIIGIPSAFLLHGYVGFIFGSVKANPWWGTVLMPIIFIFSAMVSGIALLMFLYLITCWVRKVEVDMDCLETIGKCLLTALAVDFSVEALDWIHRLYVADESIDVLVLLASGKLIYSLFVLQVFMGMILPGLCLAGMVIYKEGWKRRQTVYFLCSVLVLVGIFAMRWNVVVGGQLFSKSLRGFTTYKLELVGQEGLLTAFMLVLLPFVIVSVMIWLFLPRKDLLPAGHATGGSQET
ncbi:MAG: polysulfide reductase NrfD [Verrucomicrobia bacterium]|nr:polysulfide reductase NrfD [Verrucomicrobiota bacterium]